MGLNIHNELVDGELRQTFVQSGGYSALHLTAADPTAGGTSDVTAPDGSPLTGATFGFAAAPDLALLIPVRAAGYQRVAVCVVNGYGNGGTFGLAHFEGVKTGLPLAYAEVDSGDRAVLIVNAAAQGALLADPHAAHPVTPNVVFDATLNVPPSEGSVELFIYRW